MTSNKRPLNNWETDLLHILLRQIPPRHAGLNISYSAHITPLNDGGMGSFVFVYDKALNNHLKTIAIAEHLFADADGVPVLATLYAYGNGQLSGVDIWKTDFTPLSPCQEIPPSAQIE